MRRNAATSIVNHQSSIVNRERASAKGAIFLILAIDAGNSNIVIGGISDGNVKFVSRMATDRSCTEDQYAIYFREIFALYGFNEKHFSGSIISSVVPPITNVLVNAAVKAAKLTPLVVGPGIKTGLNIQIDNPATLGGDIIMNNIAASRLYKKAVIVADLGTATTISATDSKGNLKGGVILPGVGVSLNALTSSASLLPNIGLNERPGKTIGTNTAASMRSGIIYGTACMLDGMFSRFLSELGEEAVLAATGGNARFIVPYCESEVVYNENLLLIGLEITYNINKKH
jgi:type III pantothenate kinase